VRTPILDFDRGVLAAFTGGGLAGTAAGRAAGRGEDGASKKRGKETVRAHDVLLAVTGSGVVVNKRGGHYTGSRGHRVSRGGGAGGTETGCRKSIQDDFAGPSAAWRDTPAPRPAHERASNRFIFARSL
jgi:hypothetical protein